MFKKAHRIIHCAVFIVLPFVSYLSTILHTLMTTGHHPVCAKLPALLAVK
jgi:hypothetical protein